MLGSLSGVPGRIAGGWQIQGIWQKQSGPALGFGDVIFNGDLKNIPLSSGQRTVQRWINADAGFERATAVQRGWAIRYAPLRYSGIRGDGMDNWDLSVIKNTYFGERGLVEFRTELINAFNHSQFGAPNTTVTSSAFGAVTTLSQFPRVIQLGLRIVY
jgi:hypothetical protein